MGCDAAVFETAALLAATGVPAAAAVPATRPPTASGNPHVTSAARRQDIGPSPGDRCFGREPPERRTPSGTYPAWAGLTPQGRCGDECSSLSTLSVERGMSSRRVGNHRGTGESEHAGDHRHETD